MICILSQLPSICSIITLIMNNKLGYTELKTELTLRSLIDKPVFDLITSPSTVLDEKTELALSVEKCLLFL